MKRRVLNKGITTLLSLNEIEQTSFNEVLDLNVDQIISNKYQPRKIFNPETIQELANSIKEQGLLQPIIVRKKDDNYELIAGERRLQACKLAQIPTISAIIRDLSDQQTALMALIENLQRENLTALEQSNALNNLQKEFNFTQQQMADSLGKSRSSITNSLRLLNLSDEVKTLLNQQKIEMGHARALLSLNNKDQIIAANQIVEQKLNVRQVEDLVRNWHNLEIKNPSNNKTKLNPNIEQLQQELASKINFPIQIKCNNNGKGKLVISYNSLDNLNKLINLFNNNN